MTTLFKNKEHYLSFRAAWAEAVNSDKAKSTLTPCDEWIVNKEHPYGTTSKGTGKCRSKGWIKAEHTILFNILRGKHPATGFTPLSNKKKIVNGGYYNNAFCTAVSNLNRIIQKAHASKRSPTAIKALMEKASRFVTDKQTYVDNMFNSSTKIAMDFIEPFNGTVTIEMLRNINNIDYERYLYNYGVGRKIYNSNQTFNNLIELETFVKDQKEAA